MKRVFYFSFICMIVLLCSACNGSVTRGIRHAGFKVGNKFICDRFYPKDKEDTSYEKIRYFTGSHLINSEGKIYELSIEQVFANNENCKEADTNIVVSAILDNKIVKGTDGKYYYLQGQNGVNPYDLVTTSDNSYYVYDLLLKSNDIVKVITANSNTGSYYVLRNNGCVYEYIIQTKDRNKGPELTSTRIIYDSGEFDGEIIDFNYAGESVTTYIKTEEKIYRMSITNQKDCSKYADVKCEYEMQEDVDLEKYKDRIIMYNGSSIITDYKQMFTIGN